MRSITLINTLPAIYLFIFVAPSSPSPLPRIVLRQPPTPKPPLDQLREGKERLAYARARGFYAIHFPRTDSSIERLCSDESTQYGQGYMLIHSRIK